MAEDSSDRVRAILEIWRRRARKLEKAHFSSASACRAYNYSLGIPLVIFTTIIASEAYQAFRDLAEAQYPLKDAAELARLSSPDASTVSNPDPEPASSAAATDASDQADDRVTDESLLSLRIEAFIVLVFGLATPVLAAIQTFMRFPERAEAHRTAASRFGEIKHEIEQALTDIPSDRKKQGELVSHIKTSIVDAIQQSPSAGTLSLLRTRRQMRKESEASNGDRAQATVAPA